MRGMGNRGGCRVRPVCVGTARCDRRPRPKSPGSSSAFDEIALNPHTLTASTQPEKLPGAGGHHVRLWVSRYRRDRRRHARKTRPPGSGALLREYRAAAKRSGTYGREWLRHVSPDVRVYATWKQIGAGASGRMSCKGPNLQQLPRDPRYRRCFIAPPGRVLVKADYSQIELRIAAKITGDTRMLAAYQKGEDLHTLTARALLGKTDVTKADRQLAKAVNFGLLYGQGRRVWRFTPPRISVWRSRPPRPQPTAIRSFAPTPVCESGTAPPNGGRLRRARSLAADGLGVGASEKLNTPSYRVRVPMD